MEISLIIGSIIGAWIITRIVYLIINYRLNTKQEAVVGFLVTFILALILGRWEYFVGAIVWFLLDITEITNKHPKKKKKDVNV